MGRNGFQDMVLVLPEQMQAQSTYQPFEAEQRERERERGRKRMRTKEHRKTNTGKEEGRLLSLYGSDCILCFWRLDLDTLTAAPQQSTQAPSTTTVEPVKYSDTLLSPSLSLSP